MARARKKGGALGAALLQNLRLSLCG